MSNDIMDGADERYERALSQARRRYAPASDYLHLDLWKLGVEDDAIDHVAELVLLFADKVDAPALDDATLAFCRLRALVGDHGLDGVAGLALGQWLLDAVIDLWLVDRHAGRGAGHA